MSFRTVRIVINNQGRSLIAATAFILGFHCTLWGQDTLVTDSDHTLLQKRISIAVTDAPLRDVLSVLVGEYSLDLNYNQSIIPPEHRITLKLENVTAATVLQRILAGTAIHVVFSRSGQIVLVNSRQAEQSTLANRYTISGFILDAESGETLPGTNVYIDNLRAGSVTNLYGFYSLTVPAGLYRVVYSYIGYETKTIEVTLGHDLKQNVELQTSILSGDTIFVVADSDPDIIETTEIGTIQLAPNELSSMPILFGEQDILKILHLLPGVTQSREGDSGFHVRGGNIDQNLVLLDEAPVYNAFHFFGFFSVFNSDAIKKVNLYKGCAPAKYGGSLSSVLDVQMNEGNYKKFQGNGGIGSIFSRLTLEGPIVKDKSSYIISGRRTYADLFTRLFGPDEVQSSSLYFYDFNLKTNYRISQKDRLYISGYFGRDVLGFSGIFRNTWGNETATARWNHVFNDKLFINSSLIFSNFNYHVKIEPEGNSDDGTVETENNINALTFKSDFQYFLNTRNNFSFGGQYVFYKFLPGKFSATGNGAFFLEVGRRTARMAALYASHEYSATDWLKLNYGLRYSQFMVDRLGDVYDFDDEDGIPIMEFRSAEAANYGGLEPRLTANFELNKSTSFKLGYARTYQYIHVLSNSAPGTPLNVWQPSSSRVSPQRADQVSVGFFNKLGHGSYDLSVELFHKEMKNQVDFKNGADIILSTLFESDLAFGKGKAYGLEIMLRKRTGKLTGWIGYSLARAERIFHEINNGLSFPPKFDRTHDFSFVMMYKINPRWSFAANWVYFTGNAITIPYGKYRINGSVIDAYSPRNAYRMPDYHRLDINFTYTTKNGNTWNFSLYNAYGRRNAYALLFHENEAMPVKLSLFSFMPSVTYNFKF